MICALGYENGDLIWATEPGRPLQLDGEDPRRNVLALPLPGGTVLIVAFPAGLGVRRPRGFDAAAADAGSGCLAGIAELLSRTTRACTQPNRWTTSSCWPGRSG